MKIIRTILFIFSIITSVEAQQKNVVSKNIAGEYLLEGIMETDCGLKLNPDSTFEFFFSQGILYRYGSGKWIVKNNLLVLNSFTKHAERFCFDKKQQSRYGFCYD